jgi:curved DNA-binding protein CbpA
MKNPYKVLEVQINATDEEIRKAWLEKVKQFPPDRFPEKFKDIREAYERIENRTSRLRHFLFSTDLYIDSPFEALTQEIEDPAKRKPPSSGDFQGILRKSFDKLHSNSVDRKSKS